MTATMEIPVARKRRESVQFANDIRAYRDAPPDERALAKLAGMIRRDVGAYFTPDEAREMLRMMRGST